jgi:hypothetical protein
MSRRDASTLGTQALGLLAGNASAFRIPALPGWR